MASKKTWEEMNLNEKIDYMITWNHSGKMSGMVSLSTSVELNIMCQARKDIEGSICESCFAHNMMEVKKELREKLAKNTELLTSEIIPVKTWPILNNLYFRLESFGDLNNTIQVINYFNFCRRNRKTTFALWTKNPFLIARAMKEFGVKKPANLIVIFSSPMKNVAVDLKTMQRVYPFIDKVFTVYDKKHAKEVEINCGSRHCLTCLQCYKKNGVNVINEKEKKSR